MSELGDTSGSTSVASEPQADSADGRDIVGAAEDQPSTPNAQTLPTPPGAPPAHAPPAPGQETASQAQPTSSAAAPAETLPPAGLGTPLTQALAPMQHRQLVKQARRLQSRGSLDLPGAARLLAQAAELVASGPDRAFILSQLARTYLRLGQPEAAITVLISERDWPHHLPAAFEILIKAAGQVSAVEPLRWLAKCPAQHHQPSPEVMERALGIALYRGDLDFGEQIVGLATELYSAENMHAALLRGRLRDRQKRESEAIDAYLVAARLGTRDSRCYGRLVFLLNKTRRLDETLEWCRRGLELGLDATIQRQLEKILVRRTALPGGTRGALQTLLPIYVRRGDAAVERMAQLPVVPGSAVQAGDLTWALGTRAGNPHLYPCKLDTAAAVAFPTPFAPRELFARPRGQTCLALGANGADWQAMMLETDGAGAVFPLPGKPRGVIVLGERCIFAFRDGTVEARTWDGQPEWRVRFAGSAFAYWLAGGGDRALTTYLDWIYELEPATGRDAGHMSVKTAPGIAPGGAARTAGARRAWIQSVGFIGARAFGIFHGGFFEIGRGARLELVEAISPATPPYRVLTDSSGQLIALKGEASMRTVGLDGRLSGSIPAPTSPYDLERLDATRFVRYDNRVIETLDADGSELHRFETADLIRSLRVIGEKELRLVVGRDVLRVRLDEKGPPRPADGAQAVIPPLISNLR